VPNRVCSWRRGYGTRGGVRCAHVHRAILFGPPQLNASRSADMAWMAFNWGKNP
jgi:hypothetical protein